MVTADPRQALIDHLRDHSLRTDGPFTLRSGKVADWYMDARQTTFDGAGGWAVGAAVLSCLDPDVVAVGGLTMGADPIAIATAMVAASRGQSLKAFSIRKAAKGHGVGGRLVGPVSPGDRVCLLEDTSTTGAAMFEALDAAVESGLEVTQALCLFDRSDGVVDAAMWERSLPYSAILVPADLGVTL